MLTECPDCDNIIKPGAKSCSCGWKLPRVASKKFAPVDPDHQRCAWVGDNVRCAASGSFSHSTTGSDNFFCLAHLNCVDPIVGAEIVRNSTPMITLKDVGTQHMAKVKAYIRSKNLERLPDEPRSEWIDRLHASTRAGVDAMIRRMVRAERAA